MWSETRGKEMFRVTMSAGTLLRQKSARSLQWVMAHEVAHGLARHQEEEASQMKLIAATTFGRLMLSGMGWMPAIAATFFISRVMKKLFVDGSLSQEQEHEADIIGAAISKAAGCSKEDIVEATARFYVDDLLKAEDMWMTGGQRTQQIVLHSLQGLLPHHQMPDQVEDSADLDTLWDTIKGDDTLAHEEKRDAVLHKLFVLWLGVVMQQWLVRDMKEHWPNSHPHWLDRVEVITNNSTVQNTPNCRGSKEEPGMVEQLLAIAQVQLQKYQESAAWPKAVQLIAAFDKKGQNSVSRFYDLKSIRSRSQESLLLEVHKQLSHK